MDMSRVPLRRRGRGKLLERAKERKESRQRLHAPGTGKDEETTILYLSQKKKRGGGSSLCVERGGKRGAKVHIQKGGRGSTCSLSLAQEKRSIGKKGTAINTIYLRKLTKNSKTRDRIQSSKEEQGYALLLYQEEKRARPLCSPSSGGRRKKNSINTLEGEGKKRISD